MDQENYVKCLKLHLWSPVASNLRRSCLNPRFSRDLAWNLRWEGRRERRWKRWDRGGGMWMGGLALSSWYKLTGSFFPPFILQQQTKRKMVKSLCRFAAVLFLGVFLHGSGELLNNATTQSYSLINFTTPATVKWTEAGVTAEEQNRDGAAPTVAATELFTSSVSKRQLDTTDISKGSEGNNTRKRRRKRWLQQGG